MDEFQKELIETLRNQSDGAMNQIVKSNFRYFITSIVSMVVSMICIISVVAMCFFYLYQYDYSCTATTVTQDSQDGGSDTYVGGDISGKANSSESEEN